MPYPEALTKQLAIEEGRIPWLYLDTEGNVTCTEGRMISDPEDCASLQNSTTEVNT